MVQENGDLLECEGERKLCKCRDEQNGEVELARVVHIGCTPFSTGSCVEPVLKVRAGPTPASNLAGNTLVPVRMKNRY